MESLYILIPIAIVFVCVAIAIFFWAVKTGQFEDLDAEGKRILFDEKTTRSQENEAGEAPSKHSDKPSSH